MATNKFPVTDLDFIQIKDGLKEYLKGQDRFADFDFEGSNLNVLLDILSYNTFQNNFYTNMAISEMFLDSAQLRGSIVSHAKELNYIPRSRASARAVVDVTLNVNNNPAFVIIPEKTKFNAVCNNVRYSFFNEQAATIIPVNGVYSFQNLNIFEGSYITEFYEVTSSDRYVISNENIDLNSIRVRVRENDFTEEYIYSEDLFGLATDSKTFFIQPYLDEKYEIFFGRDIFGIEPKAGSVIEVEYRITAGEDANGITNFSIAEPVQGYESNVILRFPSRGGAEKEDIKSIKYFAPKAIQIQQRAVTASDYEILLRERFPEISAISVFGGEEATPPQYGRVIVAVDVPSVDGLSTTNREKYRIFLKERSSLTIDPVIVQPEFMYFDISTNVKYNTKTTNLAVSDIIAKVKQAVLDYSNENLGDFKKTLRFSKLVASIDDSDENIISNELSVRPIIEIKPGINAIQNFVLKFRNSLFIQRNTALLGQNNIDQIPVGVISSPFSFNNLTCFLRDNGLGVLEVLTKTNTGIVVIKRNAGTVDYQTGEVQIRQFTVNEYSGNAIKIFATTINKDIVGPRQKIIKIRQEDIKIQVAGTRE